MNKKIKVLGFGIIAMAVVVVVTGLKMKANANAAEEACIVKNYSEVCTSAEKKGNYKVKLYKGNALANGFDTKVVEIKNLTAYSILKELKAFGAVDNNVKALSLDYKGNELTLDLSKAFVEDIQNVGTSGEYVKVGSIVNTFIEAFKVDTLTITVEGKAWESGHTTYDGPLEKYGHNVGIYVSNEQADGFDMLNVVIYNLTAYSILEELKIAGAVAKDVKANSLDYVNGVLTLDLSKEFLQDVDNCGTAGEYVKIGAVVNTFLQAFNVNQMVITVDGNIIETGHATYDKPFVWFE